MYSVLSTIPKFHVSFNYVTWFGVIYVVASYIRLYPHPIFEKKRLWAFLSFLSIALAISSVLFMQLVAKTKTTFFVSDSNKLLALLVAVTTFLWFKNMKLPQSRFINAVGASTFGVLLIHANSDAMRQWLWLDTVDCVGHYDLPLLKLVCYANIVVLIIFFVCILIDRIRVRLVEMPFFRWYDAKKISKNG